MMGEVIYLSERRKEREPPGEKWLMDWSGDPPELRTYEEWRRLYGGASWMPEEKCWLF